MIFKKGLLVFDQAGAMNGSALDELIEEVKNFDVDAAAAAEEEPAAN
jgi:thioredoxin reductase (NADPH)